MKKILSVLSFLCIFAHIYAMSDVRRVDEHYLIRMQCIQDTMDTTTYLSVSVENFDAFIDKLLRATSDMEKYQSTYGYGMKIFIIKNDSLLDCSEGMIDGFEDEDGYCVGILKSITRGDEIKTYTLFFKNIDDICALNSIVKGNDAFDAKHKYSFLNNQKDDIAKKINAIEKIDANLDKYYESGTNRIISGSVLMSVGIVLNLVSGFLYHRYNKFEAAMGCLSAGSFLIGISIPCYVIGGERRHNAMVMSENFNLLMR